ncbi:LysR family transcriptional regulator [Corallococcus sp. M34]|uniref:LysR family transcriptional regulator n=1 Tax=Citreicoccus inhibens TaxID=2849499 RepID=UPI001C21AE2A|nr:LysR family transcriptional regulator [Citreicoccus inhibens]MBU8896708.1 LysR family transcriptional regulator [Citreicoccus inhibens]
MQIDHAHLARLDLNLLVAFDALMRERHVTRAAARIGIGQSAMSHHLGRLRALLGDELFTRRPGGVEPTPHARSLAEAVQDALARIQTLVVAERRFHPATDAREFRVGITDGLEISLMPRLMARAAAEAPGGSLALSPLSEAQGPRLLDEGALDLLLGPIEDASAAHKHLPFCAEGYVCLFNPELVQVGTPLSLEDFLRIPHVRVSRRADASDVVDDALAKLRQRRRVALHTAQTLSVPYILKQSPFLGILPRRSAVTTAAAFGLAVSPSPIPLPERRIAMRWHASRDPDEAHRWLREALYRIAVDIKHEDEARAAEMAALSAPPRGERRRAEVSARRAPRKRPRTGKRTP